MSNFLNSKENTLFVENFSGIELDNLDDLELALSKADLITTSVGPNHLLSVINSMVNIEFEKSPVFIAFENKYRASSTAYKEAKVEIEKLDIIDAVVDKIVPPQSTESLDVTVEEFGSIVLEEQPIKPLKSSEVVSYGDYEKEFIKKLLLLGYVRTSVVREKSEFAVRGSIIDIFLTNNNNPIRIDFFDKKIDKISEFDRITQKTIKDINKKILINNEKSNYIKKSNTKNANAKVYNRIEKHCCSLLLTKT